MAASTSAGSAGSGGPAPAPAPAPSSGGGYWGYLIQDSRSASPQLHDLCIGLTKIIRRKRRYSPSSDSELTPQRLATFYRETGRDYDSLFLDTDNLGISYIYRTLGCRHSLQPTQSDYETPSIPCLTDEGFARWQAVQLLLCPEDAARNLQKAVEVYDVPRPDGGIFPKAIPGECFPTKPDAEFEKWYNSVINSINQESRMPVNHTHRLKNSPYHSPYPEHHSRRDSYFDPNGRPMYASRSHSASRDEQARLAAMQRRRSVPDVISGLAGADGGRHAHWHPSTRLDGRGRENSAKSRSHSASRPSHTRQRSSTTPVSPVHPHMHYPGPADRRHGSKQAEPISHSSSSRPPSSYYHHHHPPAHREGSRGPHGGSRHRPPTAVDGDDDTGSEASSENSYYGRHSSNTRKSDDDRPRRRRSIPFWQKTFFGLHRRRDSSDTSPPPPLPPRAIEGRRAPVPSPLRPEYYQPKHAKVPVSLRTAAPAPPAAAAAATAPGVRFRESISIDNIPPSSSYYPPQQQQQPPPPPSGYAPPPTRYSDPQQPQYPTQQLETMAVGHPLGGSNSNSNSSGSSGSDRGPPRRPSAPVVPVMRLSSASGGPSGRP